jgi:translocating chain-associated membrane protein 1
MVVKRRTSTKNPPILSHDFVIQNHADIVACVAMVFVVGLMFQVTSPMASLFIALHHNASVPVPVGPEGQTVDMTFYTAGLRDVAATFFYLLIAVVMHQIIQEYLLDRVNRKLHLSKIKHAKFNESGQLLSFYLASILWGADIMLRENLFSVPLLWEGYPHVYMTFIFKFFFIVQISYWLHIFPELYFQKVKREDMGARVQYATLYLAFIIGAYVFCFTRVALCLLLLQYVVEALFHACRLLSYSEKSEIARPLYRLHDLTFVLARLGSISLAVLVFWYGLAQAPKEQQVIDIENGNYNTFVFRLNVLIAVGLLQAWLMWNFITFHLRRMRESQNAGNAAGGGAGGAAKGTRKSQQEKAKDRKANRPKREDGDDQENDLPEVDQNTKKTLRQRVK